VKYIKRYVVSAGIFLSISSIVNIANAGLIVTEDNNADNLVNNLVAASTLTSDRSVLGNELAFGTFTGGLSAGIGFDTGIILSTGAVKRAVGPNESGNTGRNLFAAGDAYLTTLGGAQSFDAAIIKFDFQSDGSDMFFNFVFASEEYEDNTSGAFFNDVFAFLLNGVNIAMVPGTTNPVSVQSTRTTPFFNDNPPTSYNYDIGYDGFTDIFTANLKGLSAGRHQIEIKIADITDPTYDSAVFIQQGTIAPNVSNDPPNSVPEPSIITLFALGFVGIGFARRRRS
jgi:hypothetical protein